MSYRKEDILKFRTNQPTIHFMEMTGCGTSDPDDVEPQEYYGFVKSVISGRDGAYLMQTIRPIKDFYCIIQEKDITGHVMEEELPEQERKRRTFDGYEAPNLFVPQNSYADLDVKSRCKAMTRDAMKSLFSEIGHYTLEMTNSWFSKKQRIEDLDFIISMKSDGISDELMDMRNEVARLIPTLQFKEYHLVSIGIRERHGTRFWLAAVSMEYDEVCILTDITDRSRFAMSLGPDYARLEEAVSWLRDKVL